MMNNEFKMECEIVQDLLPAYLEHDVSEQTETLVMEHLKECENCSEIYRQMTNSEIDILQVTRKQRKKRFKKKVTLKLVLFCYVFLLIAIICFCFIDAICF